MIPLLLASLASAANPDGCSAVALSELTRADAPAIIVLGETPGEPDDLRRAARVVRQLRGRADVTVAVEAVHHTQGRALAALRAPEPDLDAVPGSVRWEAYWRWPYEGYRPLFELGLSDIPGGVTLVPVGPEQAPPAGTRITTLPDGYDDRLARLAGPEMPASMRGRLAEARTWSDAQIVERALDAWKGEGYLVIVADRTRVAGPGGIDWQLAQRVTDPVATAVLDWADLDCVDGTQQVRAPRVTVSVPSFTIP